MARPTNNQLQEAKALHSEGLRRCINCNEISPESNYSKFKKGRYGLAGRCKACINEQNRRYYHENKDPAKIREKSLAAYHRQTPEHKREMQLKRNLYKYGMSVDTWHQMLKDQQGRCEICSKPFDGPKDPSIDHCHVGGHVRGLLCGACNLGLGAFRDNTNALRAAAAYLERPLC